MSVDRTHADRIAHLARLRLEDDELTRITADLNRILEHVESLAALDAEGGGGSGASPAGVAGTTLAGSSVGTAGTVGAAGTGSAAGGHLPTSGAPTVVDCAPTRGPGAETPDELARDLSAVAPDWRDGFFVVPPLPGVHEPEGA